MKGGLPVRATQHVRSRPTIAVAHLGVGPSPVVRGCLHGEIALTGPLSEPTSDPQASAACLAPDRQGELSAPARPPDRPEAGRRRADRPHGPVPPGFQGELDPGVGRDTPDAGTSFLPGSLRGLFASGPPPCYSYDAI